MSGSKAKGKNRTSSGSGPRSNQKQRPSLTGSNPRNSASFQSHSLNSVSDINSSSSDSLNNLSNSSSANNTQNYTDNSSSDFISSSNSSYLNASTPLDEKELRSVIGSLVPDKSDEELSYSDLISALNSSFSNAGANNLSLTDAVPAVSDLIALQYDLNRLLSVATRRLDDCDKSLGKLKRFSAAIDRESAKRAKLLQSSSNITSSTSSSQMLKSRSFQDKEDNKLDTDKKEKSLDNALDLEKEQNGDTSKDIKKVMSHPDLVTIKTEVDSNSSDLNNTSSLPTDTTGLSEPDPKRSESPPEYEKNPKSEFVESQELPIAALNLFEEQVKGLPTNGEEYLLKKYAVASYPHDDLKTWLPGDIPDKDFTKAKPPNQVQFSTFSSYIEPYFRPFTEDDLNFLSQRLIASPSGYAFLTDVAGVPPSGSNSSSSASQVAAAAAAKRAQLSPYVIPKLGRLYSEVWKEQDGENPGYTLNPPAKPNPNDVKPKGSSNDITDLALEKDFLSCGPLATRLLSAIMSEESVPDDDIPVDNKISNNQKNSTKQNTPSTPNKSGEDSLIKKENIDSFGLETEEENENDDTKGRSFTLSNTNWTIGTVSTDFDSLEERLKREFKYVGILDIPMLKNEERRRALFDELAGPPAVPLPPAVANAKANSRGHHSRGSTHNAIEDVKDTSIKTEKTANGTSADNTEIKTEPDVDNSTVASSKEFEIDWINDREDDEISTELRYLQNQLNRISRVNWAYQRILLPLVEQQLAWQEYSQILEDLDKQVDQAYLRRNRANTRVKKKKGAQSGAGHHSHQNKNSSKANGKATNHDHNTAATPGTPGGTPAPNGTSATAAAAAAAAGLHGDQPRLRALLDKRARWINKIGPAFPPPRQMKSMALKSIFQDDVNPDELIKLHRNDVIKPVQMKPPSPPPFPEIVKNAPATPSVNASASPSINIDTNNTTTTNTKLSEEHVKKEKTDDNDVEMPDINKDSSSTSAKPKSDASENSLSEQEEKEKEKLKEEAEREKQANEEMNKIKEEYEAAHLKYLKDLEEYEKQQKHNAFLRDFVETFYFEDEFDDGGPTTSQQPKQEQSSNSNH